MDLNNKSFKQTYKDFLRSSQFAVVLMLTLTQSVIIGYFQIYIKSQTYNDQQQMQVALFSLFVTLIFSSVLKAYCSFHMGKSSGLVSDENLLDFIKRTFVDWVITEVRAQIRVLIGLCLFIVPGIIEALRLTLSVPITFYDKRMSNKTFDPIDESRELLHMKNPVLWTLFGLVILAPTFVYILLQNGEVSFFESPISMARACFSALVFSLLTSYTYLYFTFLYKESFTDSTQPTSHQTTQQTGEK